METIEVDKNTDKPKITIKIDKVIIHANPIADYEGWNNNQNV